MFIRSELSIFSGSHEFNTRVLDPRGSVAVGSMWHMWNHLVRNTSVHLSCADNTLSFAEGSYCWETTSYNPLCDASEASSSCFFKGLSPIYSSHRSCVDLSAGEAGCLENYIWHDLPIFSNQRLNRTRRRGHNYVPKVGKWAHFCIGLLPDSIIRPPTQGVGWSFHHLWWATLDTRAFSS